MKALKMLADKPSDLDEREAELWDTLTALFENYCGGDWTRWPDRMASFELVEGQMFRPIRKHMALGRRKAMLAIQRALEHD